jgi:hypothetical protein
MAVDSTRLQDLTPYLHAFWYSLYQMGIALYFLHNQLGVASLAGVVVIVMGIPMTSSVAVRLKTIQKVVSKLRDERVKLSNEVLAGMKVIKLQAWEEQYQARINVLRDKELAELKKYTVTQVRGVCVAASCAEQCLQCPKFSVCTTCRVPRVFHVPTPPPPLPSRPSTP